MRNKLFKLSDLAGRVWCGLMHDQITWPIHGRYRCRTCWRECPVAWGEDLRFDPAAPAHASMLAHPVSNGDVSVHVQTGAGCPA
jgi:hypothetical protein